MFDIDDSYDLRLEMIERQLQRRGINNPDIIQAFESIPRHLFIPDFPLAEAYSDQPLPIKAGQTISQPYVVALMLDYLDIHADHVVLEIGSGSGYATALLSLLCAKVDGVEVFGELVDQSRAVISQLELDNTTIQHRSAWEQIDPVNVYDRIILWASPPKIPTHLFLNLKEGGIMVAPEGKASQFVWIYKKELGNITKVRKDAVRFVPLLQGSMPEIDFNIGGKYE